MVDATGETVSVTMTAPVGPLGTATMSAAGTTITIRDSLPPTKKARTLTATTTTRTTMQDPEPHRR